MRLLIIHPSHLDRATGINAQAYAAEFSRRGHAAMILAEGAIPPGHMLEGIPWQQITFDGPWLAGHIRRQVQAFAPTHIWLMGARLKAARAAIELKIATGAAFIYHAEDDDLAAWHTVLQGRTDLDAMVTAMDGSPVDPARLQDFVSRQDWPILLSWFQNPDMQRGIEPVTRQIVMRMASLNTAIWTPLQQRLTAENGQSSLLAPAVVQDRDFVPEDQITAARRQLAAQLAGHGYEDGDIIVFCGGTIYGDNPDFRMLADCLAMHGHQGAPLFFVHAGKISDNNIDHARNAFTDKVKSLFLGFADDAVYDLLSAGCDIFACPGLNTGFNRWRLPSRVVRPMAAGKAVFLFETGFGEDLEHGVHAALTREDNVVHWAAQFAVLLDADKRQAIGDNARAFARQYLHVSSVTDALEQGFSALNAPDAVASVLQSSGKTVRLPSSLRMALRDHVAGLDRDQDWILASDALPHAGLVDWLVKEGIRLTALVLPLPEQDIYCGLPVCSLADLTALQEQRHLLVLSATDMTDNLAGHILHQVTI